MTHKHYFESLDKALQDVLQAWFPNGRNRPFGGITIILEGDFWQILLMILKDSQSDILNAFINSSYIWKHCEDFWLR